MTNLFQIRLLSLLILFLTVSENLKAIHGLNCWLGIEGDPITPAADAVCASGDTCKATIKYETNFMGLPSTTLSCVDKTSDIDCNKCSIMTLQETRGCVLYSTDGTSISYCSQKDYGNRPLVTSCFQGTFTFKSQPKHSSCSPTSTLYEFCKLDYTNNPIAPIASCSTDCVTSDSIACCNYNNCNKPLACYVGRTYVNVLTSLRSGNYEATLCPAINTDTGYTNVYCQTDYSYDSTNGMSITGSCADGSCTQSSIFQLITGSSGTSCCSSNLCNNKAIGSSNLICNLAFGKMSQARFIERLEIFI